jgi:bacterioferritin (cytochrome b1)
MKIIRTHGWIKIIDENNRFVDAICLSFTNKSTRELVKNHIKDQEEYIKRLSAKLDLIKKVFAGKP